MSACRVGARVLVRRHVSLLLALDGYEYSALSGAAGHSSDTQADQGTNTQNALQDTQVDATRRTARDAPAPHADLADAVTEYAEARSYYAGLWRTSETNMAIQQLRTEAADRRGDARDRLAAALTSSRYRANGLAGRLRRAEQDGTEAAFTALDTAEQLVTVTPISREG
jgi:hypothetical protein